MINKFNNNNYNDSIIFNDDNYHSLIEEYNDIIKDNISDKENDNL
ncbi:hypothetical protein R4J17_09640 [Brachyspira intermedia]